MSEKNMDKKNRWRNVTIAFRMSPEENEELDKRVKLCGYQTRQEYIIESVLYQKMFSNFESISISTMIIWSGILGDEI